MTCEIPIGLKAITVLVPSIRAYGDPEEITKLVPVSNLPRAERTLTNAQRRQLKEIHRVDCRISPLRSR